MALNDVSLSAGMRTNLINLQGTVSLLDRTQGRLASGKKVNSPLDNPTNYFAAQAHLNRASDLDSRKDGMNEAIQTVKAATNGIEGVKTLIESARGIAQSALSASATDRTTLAAQYDAILTQITNLAADSGYKGINLLASSGQLDVKFNEDGSNSLTIGGFDASAAGLTISTSATVGGGQGWADVGAGTANITASITDLSEALTTLRTQSQTLASNLNIVNIRADFTSSMINTLVGGADKLTAADMNEEGANMLMLQTRQSLSTTALSLSAQAAQSVLRLF
ncbi:MAG TPA: flagellin [Bacteroidetes bacterium]|jgi:flagellin|nr:flagellin [Bacteroidota bacterium]